MENIVGIKTTYVIYQERPEVQAGMGLTVPLIYNAYSGSFNETSSVRDATHFDVEEEAIQLATLQNQITQILRQNFNYIVIKLVDERTSVYSGKEVDEPEEPELPEEPIEDPEEPIDEPEV